MEEQNIIATTTNLVSSGECKDSEELCSKLSEPEDFLKNEKSGDKNISMNDITSVSSTVTENTLEPSGIDITESQKVNADSSVEFESTRVSDSSVAGISYQDESSKKVELTKSSCENSDLCLSEKVEEKECVTVEAVKEETKVEIDNLHEKSIDLKEEEAISNISNSPVIKDSSILETGCEESTKSVAQNGKGEELCENTRIKESNDSSDSTDNQESNISIKEQNVCAFPKNSLDETSQKSCASDSSTANDGVERPTEIIELVEYTNLEKMKDGETVVESSELIEIVVHSKETNIENGVEVKTETSELTENENSMKTERIEEQLANELNMNTEKEPREETINNGKCISPKPEVISSLPDTSTEKTNDSTSSSMSTSSVNPTKSRSVIEDIFEDWQDENPEEDSSQQLSKSHDSVEMELKILLRDDKPEGTCELKSPSNSQDQPGSTEIPENAVEIVTKKSAKIKETSKLENSANQSQDKIEEMLVEETKKSRRPDKFEMSTNREKSIRLKTPGPRPGVKVPGILLTSPIVSKSDVSKVLKERIREQQKDFDSPTKPDIFFVKKLTQRLSHKLAAASAASQVPGLLPIPQISKTTNEGKKTNASGVDKELLAILEGDVDPDWSNLKSHDEPKGNSTLESGTTKLDPTTERELALKQLLELPSTPAKKVTKKITAKSPRAKATKSKVAKREEEAIKFGDSNIESMDTKEDSMDSNQSSQSKNDETRSGRRRKLTEKAREHESSAKRLKIFKGKTIKGSSQEKEISIISDSIVDKNDSIETVKPPSEIKESINNVKKLIDDSVKGEAESVEEEKTEVDTSVKKVSSKPGTKRKISTGQKLNKKPPLGVKSKIPKGIGKKAGTKVTSGKKSKVAAEFSSSSAASNVESKVEAKPKKKMINEIDRLLQDEGVVNLLYDVEQPDKKRFVPITKSQTKVMDIQKIQRELKIRTKLVRNAVLRLRTSNVTSNKVSPRSKRSVSHSSDVTPEKKSNESKVVRSTSPTDFIYPAKIRNAADASIIIRRHSSSSFSSASASPRASIDGPERLSIDGKFEDSGTHLLRSNKRRISIEDDKKKKKKIKASPEAKKNRRRTVERSDSESKNLEDELSTVSPKNKYSSDVSRTGDVFPSTPRSRKADKKGGKLGKQPENFDVTEKNGKIATRSNGATAVFGDGKVIPKSKKSVKCKVTFAQGIESMNKKVDSSPGQQDELSACLAEAVTALSNDSGGSSRSRSNIPVNRNKTKGSLSSAAKNVDIDEKPLKKEPKVQFSNNEIMVQRHGKLVQLLLTPSTTTKIRNGITLQVMQEIRENLSILKKDEDCRVVLLTSTGTSFCEGLELSTLLHENKEQRRLRAEELANAVKEFIKSLATFNKPIVAGVQGTAIGLGVTMLPWFDLVIASDKATFSTPYGKLGQIAEGAAIFTLSHILGSAVTSDLLLGGRTLTANEALRAGLVTRVLWPDRFKDELLPSLRAMSEQSSQSMEATKALLRHSLRKKLDAALESESYLLVQHWCSAECQAAITAYVDEKIH